jgi:hypothetical protein
MFKGTHTKRNITCARNFFRSSFFRSQIAHTRTIVAALAAVTALLLHAAPAPASPRHDPVTATSRPPTGPVTPKPTAKPASASKPASSGGSSGGSQSQPSSKAAKSSKSTKSSKPKGSANSASVARTSSGRLRPTPRAKSNVPAGKVETVWSVQNPLIGWERLRDNDWPIGGEALGAVGKKSSVDVRRGPSVGEPGLRFTKGRSSTGAVTLLIIQDYGDWVQVAIPVRPNGTVGWVLSSDIQRLNITYRVIVEVSTNTMIVEHQGVELWRESVATGTGDTPTPLGLFFVREIVKGNPNGPYGPYVLGLSGYSEVLIAFAGGEGAIAIHGTNAPNSIGSNASFGCVRITNDSMQSLVRVLPLGTPVEIVASFGDLPTTRRSRGIPDPEPFVEIPLESAELSSDGVDIQSAAPYNAEAIDFISPVEAPSTPDDSTTTTAIPNTANSNGANSNTANSNTANSTTTSTSNPPPTVNPSANTSEN